MRQKAIVLFLVLGGIFIFSCQRAFTQENQKAISEESSPPLSLYEAVMCEDIVASAPINKTVVFSAAREKAVCYTAFDAVPEKIIIYHNWFYKDIPSAKIRLLLQPPRWSTYSSIQIRKTDIGPWRVEITDERGSILHVLRFSITD